MYDDAIAAHYAAYRPPIHAIILEKVLQQSRYRDIGLDIGCGTGRSTLALTKFCDYVVGLEPSKSMLFRSEVHGKVNYLNACAENLPLAARSVDVVTLAGSLSYIERDSLVSELLRICHRESEIVVYDFEILLSHIEKCLGIESPRLPSEYDHSLNLSERSEFEAITAGADELSLIANSFEIAHLLLSDLIRHETLCQKYGTSNILTSLESDIRTMSKETPIKAKIYYSLYSLV